MPRKNKEQADREYLTFASIGHVEGASFPANGGIVLCFPWDPDRYVMQVFAEKGLLVG